MRKYLAWILILAITVAIGIAAKAFAAGEKPVTLRVGTPILTVGAAFTGSTPENQSGPGYNSNGFAGRQPPSLRPNRRVQRPNRQPPPRAKGHTAARRLTR